MSGSNWLPEFDVQSGARCRERWCLRGPLRDRVVKHMESIPAVAEIGSTSWYPGKRYAGIIGRAQVGMRVRT